MESSETNFYEWGFGSYQLRGFECWVLNESITYSKLSSPLLVKPTFTDRISKLFYLWDTEDDKLKANPSLINNESKDFGPSWPKIWDI